MTRTAIIDNGRRYSDHAIYFVQTDLSDEDLRKVLVFIDYQNGSDDGLRSKVLAVASATEWWQGGYTKWEALTPFAPYCSVDTDDTLAVGALRSMPNAALEEMQAQGVDLTYVWPLREGSAALPR